MREIKFRAWDKISKSWFNSNRLYIRNQTGEVYDRHDSLSKIFPSTVTLMQYTGLKDRLGVEIYEGDIVRRLQQWGGYADHKVVEWKERTKYVGFNLGNGQVMNWEVIGNIYENPELLDAKG